MAFAAYTSYVYLTVDAHFLPLLKPTVYMLLLPARIEETS